MVKYLYEASTITEYLKDSMNDHVLLIKADKDILAGKRDESEFANFTTRKSQIRWRVRNRGKALVQEIELLGESGEEELVVEVVDHLIEEVDALARSDVVDQLDRLERDLRDIEQKCEEISTLRSRLQEIEQQLQNQ